MSEYVPTTEMRDRIEDALMDYGRDREDAAYLSMVKPDLAGALAEILSVLAAARREGQAEAWDEAAEEVTEWAVSYRYEPHANGPSDPPRNPYRNGEDE